MKTKFTSILKVRKLEVDKVENQLQKLKNQLKQVQISLEELKKELKNLTPPKNGNISQLKQSFMINQSQYEAIKLKEQNILFLEEQIKLTEQNYKKVMLEYEKIAHLNKEEQKKQFILIKKQQEKELDEIGTLLFSRK